LDAFEGRCFERSKGIEEAGVVGLCRSDENSQGSWIVGVVRRQLRGWSGRAWLFLGRTAGCAAEEVGNARDHRLFAAQGRGWGWLGLGALDVGRTRGWFCRVLFKEVLAEEAVVVVAVCGGEWWSVRRLMAYLMRCWA
jgi:hypothetical protein